MHPAHPYIVIEGNIGAGKTSLAQRLSADCGAKLILEEFEDNSFLPKFYEEPKRFAFPLEMSFLAARFNQLKLQLVESGLFNQYIISDYMFAKSLLFSKTNLDDDEYGLYMKLFEIINLQVRQPDLLVYLHSPVEKLKWNITNRGRAYEQGMAESYLQALSENYNAYLQTNTHLRILIVDCAAIDFVNNEEHYASLRSQIFKAYEPGIHYVNWLLDA